MQVDEPEVEKAAAAVVVVDATAGMEFLRGLHIADWAIGETHRNSHCSLCGIFSDYVTLLNCIVRSCARGAFRIERSPITPPFVN